MLAQILNLALKELIQTWRDRVLIVFLVLGPVIQFFLLAQTTGSDILHLPLAVLDEDKSSLSRQLIATLDNTPDLDLRYYPASREELDHLLDRGDARVGIVIPRRFAATLGGAGTTTVQLLADGTSYLEASTAIRVAQGTLAEMVLRGLGGSAALPGIELRSVVEYNPQLNIRMHTIPAQLSLIVLEISLVVAALSIARERELGTLEQLRMTPIRNAELLLGKGLFAVAVGFVNFLLVLAVSQTVFHLPLRGSLVDLLIVSFLFVAANAAMGLLLSVLSGSQQQALLLVFLICVLQVNVSGYLLSVNNMPQALQVFAEFSPLRHHLTSIREILIKGTPLYLLRQYALTTVGLTLAFGAAAWGLLARQRD